MNSKYRKSVSKILPVSKGRYREYVRKWLVVSGLIGLVTSIAVIFLDFGIRILLLGNQFGGDAFTGIIIRLYNISPVFSFVIPFGGMIIVGLFLRTFASQPLLSGTEEVLDHYHENRTPMKVKEGFVKYIAAILTIGFGGSAGLEGPSINAGSVAGSWLWQNFRERLGLTQEDLRIMLLAGASAGIAAVFKAPLTGIIFALEVPYKDDIARKAFLPSIISGVVSYIGFASVEGFQPLFGFPISPSVDLYAITLSAVLGIIIGLLAVGFAILYHSVSDFYANRRFPFISRYVLGGAVLGAIALLVRYSYHASYTYGAGYFLIEGSLLGSFSIEFLLAIIVLRMIATTFTLASGAVGGIFFPLVVFGSLVGSLFGVLTHSDITLFASVGIAAFMSAGYKTPLAAVTFVGDTTGSVSYLIPAMIASFVAYIVSGDNSVSSKQRTQEEVHVHELLGVKAMEALTTKITPLSSKSNITEIMEEFLRQRSTAVVVLDEHDFPRIVSLEDVLKVSVDKREATVVESLPLKNALVVKEDDELDFVMRKMLEERTDIAAVRTRSGKITGTLTKNSIMEYLELRRSVLPGLNSEPD
ncbi:MAG: chloride channel protein [Nitrososphaerota archaeon]|nr:chloride channel protein [Nitrososphaerota archaeon]